MRRIKASLQNQDGSSLMIAIVVLLIAAVLGGIVISAAAVNMNRAARDREEQAYLLAESTALLFRDLVVGQNLTITTGADGKQEVKADGTAEFVQMMTADVKSILGVDGTPVEQVEKTLDLTGAAVLGDQQAQVAYKMNGGYGLELSIEILDKGAVQCRLMAEFPAVLHTQDGVTGLTWNRGAITRMEPKSVEVSG